MPRHKRTTWLNYPHLVVAHANSGACLFAEEQDYSTYLSMLRQLTRDHLIKVYAYCLLETEIRLVILPSRLLLPKIIQRLHGQYSSYINSKYQRHGSLFRGRYKSLMFAKNDLIDVVRSVHLWPVRKGLLRRPELYSYSSHSYYTGYSNNNNFIYTNEVLDQFSGDKDKKRRAFARFVESLALNDDDYGLCEVLPGIGANGKLSPEISQRMKKFAKTQKKSSIKTLAQRTTLLLGLSNEQLTANSRNQELVMARRLLCTAAVLGAGRTVTEVATFLNKDKAQVSRLVTQGMDLLNSNEAFRQMFASIKPKGAERA